MPQEFLSAGTLCSIYLERKRQYILNWSYHSCNRNCKWTKARKNLKKKKKPLFFGVPNLPRCNEPCLLPLCFGFSEWYQYSWLELLYYCLFTKATRDQECDNVKNASKSTHWCPVVLVLDFVFCSYLKASCSLFAWVNLLNPLGDTVGC